MKLVIKHLARCLRPWLAEFCIKGIFPERIERIIISDYLLWFEEEL